MIVLGAQQAGRALGVGALAGPVTGVSIDSRTLRPGDLFLALRGEHFDGHDYVQAALAAGASAVVVEEEAWQKRVVGVTGDNASEPRKTPPVYQVRDTLEALAALAREVRRASGALVFAVTGSAGKTSTKDVLKAMVGRARKVIATEGNQNNEIGVPLTLLEIEPDTEAVVVEMGMRGLGQISYLAGVAEPDVGVITNVHPVHLELLGDLDNIARAKAELVHRVRPRGTVVIPADCPPLQGHLDDAPALLLRFGVGLGGQDGGNGRSETCAADVSGWLETRGDGCDLVVRSSEGETRVTTGHLPRHALENAVAAVAACYAAGLPLQQCMAGIAEVELSGGRGQTVEVGGIVVIDDTYNANPAATRAALDHLVTSARHRCVRAVAVLGDMLELGPETERFHEEIGAYCRGRRGNGALGRRTVVASHGHRS